MDQTKIDYNITPENAKNLGLMWWRDHIYDSDATEEANKDIKEMLEQGAVFGSPATPDGRENQMIGIYKKITPAKA